MNLTQYIGESITHRVKLTLDSTAFNPAGHTLIFTAKEDRLAPDTEATFQKTTGAGITTDTASAEYFAVITMVPADTNGDLPGTKYWDIKARNTSTGANRIVAVGQMDLKQPITLGDDTSVPIYTTEPTAVQSSADSAAKALATVTAKLVTGNYTALPGDTLLVDSSAGPFTITLPSPEIGVRVILKDVGGALDLNPVTVLRSSGVQIFGFGQVSGETVEWHCVNTTTNGGGGGWSRRRTYAGDILLNPLFNTQYSVQDALDSLGTAATRDVGVGLGNLISIGEGGTVALGASGEQALRLAFFSIEDAALVGEMEYSNGRLRFGHDPISLASDFGTASGRNVGQEVGNLLEFSDSGTVSLGGGATAGRLKIWDTVNGAFFELSISDSEILFLGVGGSLALKPPSALGATALIDASGVGGIRVFTLPDVSGTFALASDLGSYVPTTRTINGQALSGNVTISSITGNAGTATALQTACLINGQSFNGTANIDITTLPAQFLLTGRADATIAADQNDWAPTGATASSQVFVDGGVADRTITGLAGGAAGRVLGITNKGTTNSIILANQSASSIAANRFLLPANVTLPPNTSIELRYDGTALVWRPWGRALANTGVTASAYGSATASPTFTVGVDGRLTVAGNVTITPAVGSITGFGTGIAAALAINTGTAGSVQLNNGSGASLTSLNASALGSGTVPIAHLPTITPAVGGTGLTTLTSGSLLVGAGTSSVTFIAAGTSGNVLTSNGTVWSSAAPTAATTTTAGTVPAIGINAVHAPTLTNAATLAQINGLSRQTQSMLYTDFMGRASGIFQSDGFQWSAQTGSGGSQNDQASETSHPGINRLSTGATSAAGYCGLDTASTNSSIYLLNDGTLYWEWDIRIPTLSDAVDRFIVHCGLAFGSGAVHANMFSIRYSDDVNGGRFQGVCRSSSSETAVDTGITVAANTWYRVGALMNANATSAQFYVNGVATGAPINTNIPTNTSRLGGGIFKTSGTTARFLDVDYTYYLKTFSAAR